MADPKAGTRVYCINGYEYRYVAALGYRHVVRRIFEDDEEGEVEVEGDEIIVDRVFLSPPTQKWSEEIARLDALLRERRVELSHLDQQALEMRQTFNQRPDIAALVDLLAGKPVFYVNEDGALIHAEQKRHFRRFEGAFARSDGRMLFWIAEDSDHRSAMRCLPYQTREQAVEAVRAKVAELVARGDEWALAQALNAAAAAGIEAPAGIAERLRALKAASADMDVANAARSLEAAQKARRDLDVPVESEEKTP